MKGLELAHKYFNAFGREMLHNQFPEIESLVAVGLCGSGSECFGFDDEISSDHDFEPGFCIFLPDESVIDRKTAFRLERAYAKLPKEFMGFERLSIDPAGGNRHGVIRAGDFFQSKVGSRTGELSETAWFALPQYALAEAVNGEIFLDQSGFFTKIRERLSAMPEDIRKKKIAGHLYQMAQSGTYNYPRCKAHGESGAAALALHTFVLSALETAFLMNHRYMPFYKWSFRALRELPGCTPLADSLEHILLCPQDDTVPARLQNVAEWFLHSAESEFGLSDFCGDLGKCAYAVNDLILDPVIRTQHILYAV